MQDIRNDLAENIDEADWEWLQPHVKRDVVVIVAMGVELLDVGVAIANDDTTSVQNWIGTQQIYKPSPEQVSYWNQEEGKRFKALIVQPYVLVQELAA